MIKLRYERKYRIEAASYQQVLQEIMTLPDAFSEAYPDRWINSIYFDSTGFSALRENLSGVSQRSKFRLRWYGENYKQIVKPVLEEKIKDNMLGYKKHNRLTNNSTNIENLNSLLNLSELQEQNLKPVVMIRYLRTYLESFDHKVRATIDRHLQYFVMHVNNLEPFPEKDEAIILEIKYDQKDEEEIDHILQAVKYRLTKNSKFVSGMLSHY